MKPEACQDLPDHDELRPIADLADMRPCAAREVCQT